MNVLFLCRANVFRSQMAEAFFNKYSKGKPFLAKSAALIGAEPMDKHVIEAMKNLNMDLSKNITKNISKEMVDWADLFIIMNSNLDPLFKMAIKDRKNVKFETWHIKDMQEGYPEDRRLAFFSKTRDKIEIKVKDLIERTSK